jgi:hypothetical protein
MRTSVKFTDTSLCRTRSFVRDFWECQVDQPQLALYCPYTLRFGDTCFCKHPERSSFARAVKGKE